MYTIFNTPKDWKCNEKFVIFLLEFKKVKYITIYIC